MELSEFIYKSRLCVLDMQMLMLQTAIDESIKKEPMTQHKLVSTALSLLIEARTLEKELEDMRNLGSDNSISEKE